MRMRILYVSMSALRYIRKTIFKATQADFAALAGVTSTNEDAFLARARHLVALDAAEVHLESASRHLAIDAPAIELFAEDLRAAQQALASITGEFTADDLLGEIFSRFCIGK